MKSKQSTLSGIVLATLALSVASVTASARDINDREQSDSVRLPYQTVTKTDSVNPRTALERMQAEVFLKELSKTGA